MIIILIMRAINPVIYLIMNHVNGKCYIGKTIDPIQRWRDHQPPKTKNYPIQYAILKHKVENFTFDIIERFSLESELEEAEIWWIAYLRSLGAQLYNITDGGDGISGYHHTAETKQLLSKNRKDLIATGWIPIKHTEEFKQQLSQNMIGHTYNTDRVHPPDCLHCSELVKRNKTNNPSRSGDPDVKKKMSKKKIGSLNNQAIMTEEKVVELRQLSKQGMSNKELSIKFGIAVTTVSGIKNRKSWKHVD